MLFRSTLAVAVVGQRVANAGGEVTGGQNGILMTEHLRFGALDLGQGRGFYALAAVCLLLTYLGFRAFLASRTGLVLRGIREAIDDHRAWIAGEVLAASVEWGPPAGTVHEAKLEGEAVRFALRLLMTASEFDSATGGVRPDAQAFATLKVLHASGVETISDAQQAEWLAS